MALLKFLLWGPALPSLGFCQGPPFLILPVVMSSFPWVSERVHWKYPRWPADPDHMATEQAAWPWSRDGWTPSPVLQPLMSLCLALELQN